MFNRISTTPRPRTRSPIQGDLSHGEHAATFNSSALYEDLISDVSQGSSATPLRCGGIVNDDFVAHLLVNLSVKKKI